MPLDDIVRRNGLRYPARDGFVFEGRRRAWRDVDARVDRVAAALTDAVPSIGGRVAILLPNCPEFLELYFGCARSGTIAVPLNYRLTVDDMAGILAHVEPSVFVVGVEYLESAAAVTARLADPPALWVVGGTQDDLTPAKALAYERQLDATPEGPVTSPASDDDVAAIFYTSGTTGLPKGAMVTHDNLMMNGYNQIVADRAVPSDVNLVATPVYHMGAVFMAVTYMMLGATQVILPRFTPRGWLETLASSRATVSLLVPTMINGVLAEPSLDDADLSRLRLIFYGGGPMPAALLTRAIDRLACSFTQGYGLTETLEATFLTADDHRLDAGEATTRRLSSAGREALGADIRIVDDSGQALPAGEIGEILVRSRSVVPGYWRNPEETARVIRDGWFHTGDLGYLDEGRYLFVVDRKKDMVVSGGVNIYTKEVESALYRHPAVLEAAVIGMPDDEWGELVTAVVALREGATVTADELIAHCGASLAGFKKPRRVEFVDELPKNPSGKILKRVLRARLAPATEPDR